MSTLVSTRHQNWRKQHVSFHWKKNWHHIFFCWFFSSIWLQRLIFRNHRGTTVSYQNNKFYDFSNIERLGRLKIEYKEYQPNFFFLVKAEMLISSFQIPGGHQGGQPDVHFTSKFNLELFYDNYWIWDVFTK